MLTFTSLLPHASILKPTNLHALDEPGGGPHAFCEALLERNVTRIVIAGDSVAANMFVAMMFSVLPPVFPRDTQLPKDTGAVVLGKDDSKGVRTTGLIAAVEFIKSLFTQGWQHPQSSLEEWCMPKTA